MKISKEEAPNLFTTQKKEAQAEKHQWVQILSGVYKGDFAKVMDVIPEKNGATLRIIPRLEFEEK